MVTETSFQPKHIVGIGASAGGLEALEKFFFELSPDTDNSYVVIQHLSPDFESVMDDLLSRQLVLPIRHVENGLPLQANTIYLNSPKTNMRIDNGIFVLAETADHRSPVYPIDQFFFSLAEQFRDRAVGVILSGTGSDGSKGVLKIKEKRGMVLVQAPDSAKFEGMPKEALNTGDIDFIGSPSELARWFELGTRMTGNEKKHEELSVTPLNQIFEFIREEKGIDFNLYKPATILRRMERRFQLTNTKGPEDYLAILKSDRAEVHLLFRDLLIEVTEFFRDPKAFEKLRSSSIAPMVNQVKQGDSLRVWVAGCATGEEPYSIAILFLEELRKQKKTNSLRIFATDIHRQSIAIASEGVYTAEKMNSITKELKDRYFEVIRDKWRVSRELRSVVVFAEHNLLRDPPFIHIDMVSCRNVLIYLHTDAQERIVRNFAYSVRTNGVLFLGSSETIGRLDKAFETIDQTGRIYQRLDISVPFPRFMDYSNQSKVPKFMASAPKSMIPVSTPLSALSGIYQQLLDKYIPSGFLIREDYILLHVFGNAGRLLRYQGPTPKDILGMLPGELRIAVSTATQRAIRQKTSVQYENVVVPTERSTGHLRVIVEPLPEERKGERYFLIRLENEASLIKTEVPDETEDFDARAATRQRLEDLESELEHTRGNLQAAVEESETSKEELQATNEELLASNEELQNSNEELKSVNEELFSVNTELERKNEQLIESNRDLNNLMNCIDIGTVFLDLQFNIRKFTPTISSTFSLRDSDIGRPLKEIATLIEGSHEVIDLCKRVIDSGLMMERRVITTDGQHFLQRIHPYREEQGSIDGIVLTYVNMSRVQEKDEELGELKKLEHSILDSLGANVAVLDGQGNIIAVNESWRRFAFENSSDSKTKMGVSINYFAACIDATSSINEESASKALAGIRDVIAGKRPHFEMEYPCHSPTKKRWFFMQVTPLERDGGGAVISHIDVSSVRSSVEDLRKFADVVQKTNNAVMIVDTGGFIEYVNPAFSKITGYSEQEAVGQHTQMLNSGLESKDFYNTLWNTILKGESWAGTFRDKAKDGTLFTWESQISSIRDDNGRIERFIAICIDTTEKERLNEELLQVQKANTIARLAGGVAHDFNNLLVPMIGYSEILAENLRDDEKNSSYIGEIHAAAVRAQELTAHLLSYGRKQTIRLVPVNLNELIVNLQGMIHRILKEGVTLQTKLQKSPVGVRCDLSLIEQVIINLINNSQDAISQKGTIYIETAMAVLDAAFVKKIEGLSPGRYALLTIRDTGEGMDEETVKNLFEPFYRRKKDGNQTGIGLATTYGIIKQHGGYMWASSNPKTGSTFKICLPLEISIRFDRDEDALGTFVNNQEKSVLIVEDNSSVRAITAQILKSHGYIVYTSQSGSNAINQVSELEKKPDLLLADVMMPEMNGSEVYTKLKELCPHLKVLYMSGYPASVFADDGTLSGDIQLINKPFRSADLLRMVGEVLEMKSSSELLE